MRGLVSRRNVDQIRVLAIEHTGDSNALDDRFWKTHVLLQSCG